MSKRGRLDILVVLAIAPWLCGCATAAMWGAAGEPASEPVALVAGADGQWLAKYSSHTLFGAALDVYFALPLDDSGNVAYPFRYDGSLEDLQRAGDLPPEQVRAIRAARLPEVARRPDAVTDEKDLVGLPTAWSPLRSRGILVVTPWCPWRPKEEAARDGPTIRFPVPQGLVVLPATLPASPRAAAAARGKALLYTPLMLATDVIVLPLGAGWRVLELLGVVPSHWC